MHQGALLKLGMLVHNFVNFRERDTHPQPERKREDGEKEREERESSLQISLRIRWNIDALMMEVDFNALVDRTPFHTIKYEFVENHFHGEKPVFTGSNEENSSEGNSNLFTVLVWLAQPIFSTGSIQSVVPYPFGLLIKTCQPVLKYKKPFKTGLATLPLDIRGSHEECGSLYLNG